MKRMETDYYDEIAKEALALFKANLADDKFKVRSLIGEISSALRTLIANGYDAGEALVEYSKSVHRLHLDISILVENVHNGKFEVIIFEVKKLPSLGLGELSQLIGYCLVSKSQFGILVNIDKIVSREFSVILDGDKNLTEIIRVVDNRSIRHSFGVMVWNSRTKSFEYTNSGSIKTIPFLVSAIEEVLL